MVERPAGSIYDLGYRPYEGERLGRRQRVVALYVYSLRAIFGLGRSALSKVFPIGLAILALVPATIQLAIAAIVPAEFELVRPENHFSFVQLIVALFCAVAAPEVIGRDQRNKTLPLYFSRAISRADYVFAKFGSLLTALLIVLIVPQVILVLGNAVATDDLLKYLQDNVDEFAPILGSAAVIAVFMTSVSCFIASQTSRRALATGAIVAYFVIATAIGSVLIETTTGNAGNYVVLVSPFAVLEGTVYWIFNVSAPGDSDVAKVDLDGIYYFLTAVAYSVVSFGLLFRRFQRLSV